MSVTARQVYNSALTLMGCVNADGTINTQQAAQFGGKALQYINIIINDDGLKSITGVKLMTSQMASLDDDMEYQDSVCISVLPYKLGYMLAADINLWDKYNYLKGQYEANLGTINIATEDDDDDSQFYDMRVNI